MPSSRGSSQDSTGDIWLQNKPTIERFYVVENKTAEEVMEIMEREYGCPHITKKAFQKIIRNKLKLCKRLKNGDWLRIYRHYLVNRKGLPTVVYHNNRKILWKDVIKEAKRSGPLPHTGRDGDATLPMDVVLRTRSPSPARSQMAHSPTTNPQQSTSSSPQPSISSPTAPVVSLADIDNALNGIPWVKFNYRMLSTAISPTDSDTNLTLDLNSSRTLIDTRLGLDSFKIWKTAVPSTRLHFLSTMPSSSALTPDIHAYHLLAKFVYLVSNDLYYDWSDRCYNIYSRTIQLLSSQIPKEVLDGLFEQDLPMLRLIWTYLTECAGTSRYDDTFISLMKAGFQHKEWILSRGISYLSFAATINALDVVQDLLDVGIRADDIVTGRVCPVIVEAAAAGNIECVKLLLGACDVNRKTIHNASSFQILLITLAEGELRIPADRNYPQLPSVFIGTRSEQFRSEQFTTASVNLKNESRRLILKMFLDCGANVDLPWATYLTDSKVYDVPEGWCLTTLEKIYYWDKSLFEELAPYSSGATEHIFQSNMRILASQGKEYLREYLSLQSPESGPITNPALELVLFQQVMNDQIIDIEDVRINIDIIQGLLEFGVDPNLRLLRSHEERIHDNLDIQDLLEHLVLKPYVHRFGKSFDTVLRLILRSGATITPNVLVAGVQKEGIDILEALNRVGADVRRYGAKALALAARLDNYDAVKLLLDSGADINAVVPRTNLSVIALASSPNKYCPILWHWPCRQKKPPGPASCEMLRYLVNYGSALKHYPSDPNAFQFLNYLLQEYKANSSLFNMIELFLSKLHPHDLLPNDESKNLWQNPFYSQEQYYPNYQRVPNNFRQSLWDAYLYSGEMDYPDEKQAKTRKENIAVFELLLKHGLLIKDGLALPSLIFYGGPPELIERLLESCVNINAYVKLLGCDFRGSLIQFAAYQGDKALVEKLLQRGADINQKAADINGKMALQAAYDWHNVLEGEEAKRVSLIQFLIEKGADINAPGNISGGYTALQSAAIEGNIEIALLLIYGGAVINTPDIEEHYTLDLAARHGRLDMVHLLLNIGAVSGIRGRTGFDGAIKLAKERGYSAVANLIRQYAETHPRND